MRNMREICRKYERNGGICGKYEGICGKHEEICEKYEGNYVVSRSWRNFEICFYIDSGTWKNYELRLHAVSGI